MKTIKFGIIGCGLMGREFASAAARWCHLPDMDVKPEIVAICDASEKIMEWYTQNFSTIKQTTKNYKELLANKEVEAVYIAVPHNLHAEFYCFHFSSSFSVSPIASSIMSRPFNKTSSSITIGGDIRRMWPAGIQARPFLNAF